MGFLALGDCSVPSACRWPSAIGARIRPPAA